VIGSIQIFKIIRRHIYSVKPDPKIERKEEEFKEGGELNSTNNLLEDES
jgi:hypothetical protein